MNRWTVFPRRRLVLFGLLVALAPLAVLLVFQYVWLTRLEETTRIAYEAALHYYVQAVGQRVEYAYRSVAERSLSLPAGLIADRHFDAIAAHWSKETSPAVERLFLVDYTREPFGNYYVYEPGAPSLVPAVGSDEALAMIVACSPWAVPSGRGRSAQLGLVSEERNPGFRFVLHPITNDESVVIGVAGMIVNENHLRSDLLPRVVDETLGHFFGDAASRFQVVVRDDEGRVAHTTGEGVAPNDAERTIVPVGEEATVESNHAVSRFPFVFTSWTVEVVGLDRSPEELARASFASNMTLAVILSALLAAGVVWALRSAHRAVRLSEMKSDFVSNVSHELRTPVASIRVFGELLRLGRADSPESVRRYGAHIENESRRLTRLIDNVLDFARLESGRREYRFVHEQLERVVEDAVEASRPHLQARGFELAFDVAERPLPPARMDPDAIGQVLHNLIDNAIKYSGDSTVLELRVFSENGSLVCSVRDEGVGIPADGQRRIFERFHRVGGSLVHDVKGTGLGLAIVQHVVRAHGGSIDVESERGKGTTVFVRLPIATPNPHSRREDDTCPES